MTAGFSKLTRFEINNSLSSNVRAYQFPVKVDSHGWQKQSVFEIISNFCGNHSGQISIFLPKKSNFRQTLELLWRWLSITSLRIKGLYVSLSIKMQCHYAGCHYAECRYAECRGAILELSKLRCSTICLILILLCFPMRLHHPPDASPFPRFKLKCFVSTICFLEIIDCTSF